MHLRGVGVEDVYRSKPHAAKGQMKMRKRKKIAAFGANSCPSVWGRLDRRWDRPRSVNRPGNQIQSDNFWRGKTARKSSKFVRKLTKLGEKGTKGTWGRVKSFRSVAQNHKSRTKSRDQTKSIWAIFVVIFEFFGGRKILGWKRLNWGVENQSKSVATLTLIPYDVGLARSSRI